MAGKMQVAVVEHPEGCHELEHDDADAVPDNVVQLARNPGAFRGEGGTAIGSELIEVEHCIYPLFEAP